MKFESTAHLCSREPRGSDLKPNQPQRHVDVTAVLIPERVATRVYELDATY